MLALVLLLLLSAYVESAPIQDTQQANSTIKSEKFEKPWAPASPKRGTLELLFPCILTLLLCVWTTIHTNIPPQAPDKDKLPPPGLVARTWEAMNKEKIVWSLVTLLFPEIALLIAAHERRTAILLTTEMEGVNKQPARGNKSYEEFWDLTLSYYAIMGGFVVVEEEDYERVDGEKAIGTDTTTGGASLGAESEKAIPTTTMTNEFPSLEKLKSHFTLTPRGVLHLANQGLLPYYSSFTVKDKSKASRLAKFLVCFQAGWMIIQVLGRYINKYPVALLELYTFLHTLCALAMYLIWMEKPLDVTQSTVIPLRRDRLVDLTKDLIAHDTETIDHSNLNVFWNHGYTHYLTKQASLGMLLFRQLWDWHKFQDGDAIDKFLLLLGAYTALWNGWKNFWWETLALSFVGMAHGGLHMAAWKYPFPSRTEELLWKISSVLTATSVAALCLSILAGFIGKSLWGKVKDRVKDRTTIHGGHADGSEPQKMWVKVMAYLKKTKTSWLWWCLTTYCIFFTLALIPCILARLYLLVESFISLRQLPIRSYDRASWVSVLPHLG